MSLRGTILYTGALLPVRFSCASKKVRSLASSCACRAGIQTRYGVVSRPLLQTAQGSSSAVMWSGTFQKPIKTRTQRAARTLLPEPFSPWFYSNV